MSGASSSAGDWSTRLEPSLPFHHHATAADDPRLGHFIERYGGDSSALQPGRPVLIGFPQDRGVGRNNGRTGAASAPHLIREHLYSLTAWDGENDLLLTDPAPLDLGDVHVEGALEETQDVLGAVVGAVLASGAIPVVLGGGHETAYGHFLGYVQAGRRVGVINIDAHLDVRPFTSGHGHSGSPFRQAIEHPSALLSGRHYVCLGAQPSAVGRPHWLYAREKGCVVRWCEEVRERLPEQFAQEHDRLAAAGCAVYVSLDADAVCAAEVPGVSAPNPLGLSGASVVACARAAGQSPAVASFDLVEVNPRFDRDGQSVRWAALAVWNFLVGVALRRLNASE